MTTIESSHETGNMTALLIDRHIASTRGDQDALRYGDKRYSYNDVAALANRAGNMLRTLGLRSGQHVLLALPPSPSFVAALVGGMKIGAVPVVVTADAIAPALETLKPPLAVVEQSLVSKLEAAGVAGRGVIVVVVGPQPGAHASFLELLREAPSSLAGERLMPTAPALVVFDGGTSVAFTHGDLQAAATGGAAKSPALAASGVLRVLTGLASGSEVLLAH